MIFNIQPGNIVEYRGQQYVVYSMANPHANKVNICVDPYNPFPFEVDICELTLINNGII